MSKQIIGMEKILNTTKEKLNKLFTEKKMPESHGLNHCLTVLGHMETAIASGLANSSGSSLITPQKDLTLKLAALLHEADDHKYFPDNKEFQNARMICDQSIPSEFENKTDVISEVILMISLVSASVNGNSVPEAAKCDPTLLWPRYCDRLESIGVIGAVRCYQYTHESGEALMIETTPRPKTEEEVWSEVKEARWNGYQSGINSASMMDHYYDKLLHIAKFDMDFICNEYLVSEAKKRVQPLVDVCVESGLSGVAPVESIKKLEKSLA